MTVKSRFIDFLKDKGMGQTAFEEIAGLSRGQLAKKGGLSSDSLVKISEHCPELNFNWLITGEGETLKNPNKIAPVIFSEKIKGSIPYYGDLPLSAGKMGLNNTDKTKKTDSIKEQPTGYMCIPNVSAEYLFPVIGCSFLPIIKAGDIVGVNTVNNWDRVEPDKIYMIVTNEDRMIKRLRLDVENKEALWCISENFKEFKIYTSEIKSIFHVVYHGEIL